MPSEIHRVRGKALQALATAARIEIVHALMACQPASVEELAAELGRVPKGLYHHLRPLLEEGLVVPSGKRPTGKRQATLFELAAPRLELDPDDRSPGARAARKKLARAVFRKALDLNARALDDPDVILSGKRRTLTFAHRVTRLTPSGLARVNAKIRELADLLAEEHDRERGRAYAFTLQLAPDRR